MAAIVRAETYIRVGRMSNIDTPFVLTENCVNVEHFKDLRGGAMLQRYWHLLTSTPFGFGLSARSVLPLEKLLKSEKSLAATQTRVCKLANP